MTKNNSFNTISYSKSFRKVFLFFLSILILALFLCSSIVYYLSVQIGTDSIGLSSISVTQTIGTLSLLFWVKAVTILGFLLISCLSVVFYLRFMSMLNKKLLDIQKGLSQVAIGNLPVLNTDSVDEFSVIDNELKLLVNNLQNVKSFALDVGKGNYDSQVVVFNNVGDLGSALAEMKGSLKEISEQDKIRNWTSDGLAKFADLFRNNNHDLQELCFVFLRDLIKYINANQGAVYVLEEQNGTKVLEMKACYAYGRKKHLNSTLMLGEGLAGQAVLEKETIYVTEVPSNYFKVTSGMGEATPRSVLIVPLIINEREIGVVELASLYELKPSEVQFVEKLAESLAGNLIGAQIAADTQRLLRESQYNTEQLQSQEEEIRQTLEEMNATQEHLQRQAVEMLQMQDKLMLEKSMFTVLMEYLTDRVTFKDKESVVLRVNTAKAKRFNLTPEQMIGTSDFDFFPKEHAQKARNQEVVLMEKGEPVLNAEEKVVFDDGKVMFINTSRIPFKNESGQIIGTFIISEDTTLQKTLEANVAQKDRFIDKLTSIMPIFVLKVNSKGMVEERQPIGKDLDGFVLKNIVEKSITQVVPDFYNHVSGLDVSEMASFKTDFYIDGQKSVYSHHVICDSIYDKVYWVLAVKELD